MKSVKIAVALLLLALIMGWVMLSCVTRAEGRPPYPLVVGYII